MRLFDIEPWECAEYIEGYWSLTLDESLYVDSDLAEIDETPIEMPVARVPWDA
ncbi:MAG: hypothetical protein ACRC8I_11865 [Plesiomonas shigelloides]